MVLRFSAAVLFSLLALPRLRAQSRPPISVHEHPQSVAVMPGGVGVLRVGATVGVTGSPSPSYQWRLNGQPVPGATGEELKFSGFTLSQAGTYTVLVSSGAVSVESAPAWVVPGSHYEFTPWVGKAGTIGAEDGHGEAARFARPEALAIDTSGNLYVSEWWGCTIRKVTPDGEVTTLAGRYRQVGTADGPGDTARFTRPGAMALDKQSNLYVLDDGGVRKIAPDGTTSTFMRRSIEGGAGAIAVDSDTGNLYLGISNAVWRHTPSGELTRIAGRSWPGAADGVGAAAGLGHGPMVIDSVRNIIFHDISNGTLRKISPLWEVSTLAGTAGERGFVDGTGPVARFYSDSGHLAIDENDMVYLADTGNRAVRRISPTGVVETITRTPSFGPGITIDGTGTIYVVGDSVITKGVPVALPFFASPVVDRRGRVGDTVTFSVEVVSVSGEMNYRWEKSTDGITWTDIPRTLGYAGTLTPTLTIQGVTTAMDGQLYRCTVINDVGSVRSHARLGVDGSQLVNLSSRSFVGAGDNFQVAGFVVAGAQDKKIMVRATGPTLKTSFQVSDALIDPVLRLYSGQNLMIETSGIWSNTTELAEIERLASQAGAFAWPRGTLDAVALRPMIAGGFTAEVSGRGGAHGAALVEVYDVDAQAPGRLVNLSTRALVRAGDDVLFTGFVIAGNAPKALLLRASGPALSSLFGLRGVMPDPVLTLFQGSSALTSNSAWSTAPNADTIERTASRVGAFPLARGSGDSALAVSLAPGAYTLQVKSQSSVAGIVIVEVYDADPP